MNTTTTAPRTGVLSEDAIEAIYNALLENADRCRKGYKIKTIEQIAKEFNTSKVTLMKIKKGVHTTMLRMIDEGKLTYSPLAVITVHTQRALMYRESSIAELKRLHNVGLISKNAFHEASKSIETEYSRLCRLSTYRRNKQALNSIAEAKARMSTLEGLERTRRVKEKLEAEHQKAKYCKQIEAVSAQLISSIKNETTTPKIAKQLLNNRFEKVEASSYWESIVEILASEGIEVRV